MQYIGNNQITAKYVGNTEVQKQYLGDTLVWENTPPQHDYSQDYLTFRINGSGNVSRESINMTAPDIYYSLNGGNWTTFSNSISVVEGDVLRFKGSNLNYATSDSSYTHFTSTANFEVEGNIMSLVYDDNFVGNTELVSAFTFTRLFRSATTIQSAENLVLPATSLTQNCYSNMFSGCTSLTTAPELPATTLAFNCYQSMFSFCSSLTTAPELPATTLAFNCYNGIFQGCTSLTTAPELPATTLANECYSYMFFGCTSLTTAPELTATTLTTYCYYNMFRGCTSLTTAPELPATTLATSCYGSMFFGCTSLTSAPELPATTLVQNCYELMFAGCSSLNYIKCLATDKTARQCTSYWVDGVSATGTFVKAQSMTGWTTDVNGIPSGWTVLEE